jgi:hypothetical protein
VAFGLEFGLKGNEQQDQEAEVRVRNETIAIEAETV